MAFPLGFLLLTRSNPKAGACMPCTRFFLFSYFLSTVIALLNRLAIFDDIHQRPLAAVRACSSSGNKGVRGGGEADPFGHAAVLADGQRAGVIPHFLQHFGLNLANTFAGDSE